MKLLTIGLLVASCQAINRKYKQSGSPVDRSKQMIKPHRAHGVAVLKRFKSDDEVSFKVNKNDSLSVVFLSDHEDIDFSVAAPGEGYFKSIEQLEGEGNYVVKSKENHKGKQVNVDAINLKNKKGGTLKVKAFPKEDGLRTRSLLNESEHLAIWNPESNLNVCFETVSLVNYAGDPLTMKVALCDIDTGVVLIGGILSGTVTISEADTGNDSGSSIPVPPRSVDGWSLVSFTPTTAGLYSILIDIDAFAGSESFERQLMTVIAVPEKSILRVDSTSIGIEEDGVHLTIKVALVDGFSRSEEGDTYMITADLVHKKRKKRFVTASALADLEPDDTLQLVIQPEWFEGSVLSNLLIEHLRISNVDGSIPLIIAKNLAVQFTSGTSLVESRKYAETTEEKEMRMTQGIPPIGFHRKDRRSLQSGINVIATHGYCAPSNPFEGSFGKHANRVSFFLDKKQGISHGEFALRLKEYGGETPCSIIAHSQGGAASLHLWRYHWSCLDKYYEKPRRLIQSVGTPYHGSVLMDINAVVEIITQGFSFYCGAVWDLTTLGAYWWLNGIPNWARARVYYTTTSFSDSWWRYDYCNLITDPFLSDPDDGAGSKWSGTLEGANFVQHTEGQCHTADMRDPSQTQDVSRNEKMYEYAAGLRAP